MQPARGVVKAAAVNSGAGLVLVDEFHNLPEESLAPKSQGHVTLVIPNLPKTIAKIATAMLNGGSVV
jgi:hypothetical protein